MAKNSDKLGGVGWGPGRHLARDAQVHGGLMNFSSGAVQRVVVETKRSLPWRQGSDAPGGVGCGDRARRPARK
jgi:hypothetical protein